MPPKERKSQIPKVRWKPATTQEDAKQYLQRLVARDTEETWSQSETFLWSLTEIVFLWGGFSYV